MSELPRKHEQYLLGLQIPNQSAPKPDNMLLDLKETEAWFEALPMANIGETARRGLKSAIERAGGAF